MSNSIAWGLAFGLPTILGVVSWVGLVFNFTKNMNISSRVKVSCPYFWYHSSALTASHPMSAICLRKTGVPHISIQLSTLHCSTGKGWAILLYTLYKNSSN